MCYAVLTYIFNYFHHKSNSVGCYCYYSGCCHQNNHLNDDFVAAAAAVAVAVAVAVTVTVAVAVAAVAVAVAVAHGQPLPPSDETVVVIAIGMIMIIAAVTGETIARPSIVRRHPYRRHFPRMPWLVFRLSVVGVGVVHHGQKLRIMYFRERP